MFKFLDKHKGIIQKNIFQPPKTKNKVDILRIDTIHPIISGNKFFKLNLQISEAIKQGYKCIATFGGYYSNHIVATACACKEIGLVSIGIIRGEEPTSLNNTLSEAKRQGMQLHFVSREAFNDKELIKKAVREKSIYWINEGGYSRLGAEGIKGIYEWIDDSYTDIVCAVGTGTMMAGLIAGAKAHQKITGICVLKGYEAVIDDIEALLLDTERKNNYQVLHGYHLGGYAKHSNSQIEWMNEFYKKANVPTDIVYTSKLCMAVEDLLQKGYFKEDSKILIIHSGGLQGNHSLKEGTLIY